MKLYLKKISYLLLSLTLFLGACETEESLIITSPDKAFVLNEPGISNIFLNFALPDNPAFTINWVDELNAAANYTVEMSIDEAFTNPIALGSTDKNNFSLSVTEFNTILTDADIKSFSDAAVYMRVNAGDKSSNVVLFQVSKFAVKLPSITSPNTGDAFVLSDVDPDAVLTTVSWDDPEITTASTVNVSYQLEVATTGTNFATVYSLGETQENSLELTHGAVNSFALDNGGTPGTPIDFDFRIRAIAKTAAGDLFRSSTGITLSITPYDVALPPTLFVVGAGAVDAGWGWGSPVELALQGKKYSGNINLTPDNGGNFRLFIDKALEWASPSYNYPYYTDRGYTIDSDFVNAMDGDFNFQFVGTAGEYFMEIDTQNKTITLGPAVVGPNCNFDQLWAVGGGIVGTGWGWDNPIAITCTGTGVYQGNLNLTKDGIFRFFEDKALTWGSPSYNYEDYTDLGYTIDARLENNHNPPTNDDGDRNFKFTGTSGVYGFTIDDINKTITLSDPISQCDLDQLWLVGAGVPDAGWAWTSPVALPCTSGGVYSGQVTFDNSLFRFFEDKALEWGSPSINYQDFIDEGYTIDANFELNPDPNDADKNFNFIGTPGTFTLTVDTVNKTITLN